MPKYVATLLAFVAILALMDFIGKQVLFNGHFGPTFAHPVEYSAEDLIMERHRLKRLASNQEQKVFDLVLPPKKSKFSLFGTTQNSNNNNNPGNYVEIADYPLFDLMDQVDTSRFLRPAGYMSLDQAHREGRCHMGAWVFITDATGGNLLVIQRAPHLVTCPNTWGVVGEHTYRDETPLETVQRALVEEVWGGSNATYMESVQFIRNLTEHPVLYLRDYGVINATGNNDKDDSTIVEQAHRIDRQLTYLYEVRLKQEAKDVVLKLDDEVAEHNWISHERFRLWLQIDAVHNKFGHFCHSSMIRLNRFCLDRLKYLREQDRQQEPGASKYDVGL